MNFKPGDRIQRTALRASSQYLGHYAIVKAVNSDEIVIDWEEPAPEENPKTIYDNDPGLFKIVRGKKNDWEDYLELE